MRTKNLLGHLMAVAKQDPTVTRRVGSPSIPTCWILKTGSKTFPVLNSTSISTVFETFRLVAVACVTVMLSIATNLIRKIQTNSFADARTTLVVTSAKSAVQDSCKSHGNRTERTRSLNANVRSSVTTCTSPAGSFGHLMDTFSSLPMLWTLR